jgi:signal transduction histidine kinase
MISALVHRESGECASRSSSSERDGPSDEVSRLREKCEHLSLAVTAMSHELRHGLHILLSHLSKCDPTTDQYFCENGPVKESKDLVLRLSGELETLATLAVIAAAPTGAVQLEGLVVQPILTATYTRWQFRAQQKGIRIRMALDEILDEVTVLSNAHWLGIMLDNIVGNAVRHTSAGEVCIEGRVQASDLVLAVRDSGPGIEEVSLRRAFDPAPAPRPNGQGLGLGLSIVRRAAEALGHGLGIRSTPFRGTSVSLRLKMVLGSRNYAVSSAEQYWDAT